MRLLRMSVTVLVLALLAAACTSDGGEDPAPTGPEPSGLTTQIAAVVASSDLYVGDPQRVGIGLLAPEGNLVSYGEVAVRFSFVGTATEPVEAEPGPEVTAHYLPTYGTDDRPGGPAVTSPAEARGVYESTGVTFDRAGFWTAEVTAEVEDIGPQVTTTTFSVLEEPELLTPGDEAYPTENLTLDSTGVPLGAIDSRAESQGVIPDERLHRTTIAQAMADGHPALVVFATPVYCISQFCGPVTDMVEDLSGRFADRAEFIHVEIWEDYGDEGVGGVLNAAAAEWLQTPSGDLTEPWLYLIGADGTIVDRWSNLWSEDEVASALESLPPMDG